jgi:hypothetical protein
MENSVLQNKSMKDILDETLNYYVDHPERRAYGESGCYYLSSDGKHCAVGRCMISPKMGIGLLSLWDSNVTSSLWANGRLDKELKEEYRGHSIEFWGKLQNLHDDPDNWDEGKLTLFGKIVVQDLKNFIEKA